MENMLAELIQPKSEGFGRKKARPAGKVDIKTKDVQTYSRRQDIAYGHPQKPMSWDDLIAKFEDCAAYSAKPLPQKNVVSISSRRE